MKNKKSSEHENQYMMTGMCIGIAIGTVLGAASDNLTTFMPVGLAVGMCIGTLIDGNHRKMTEDSSDKGNN